jgi:hypothetical protein
MLTSKNSPLQTLPPYAISPICRVQINDCMNKLTSWKSIWLQLVKRESVSHVPPPCGGQWQQTPGERMLLPPASCLVDLWPQLRTGIPVAPIWLFFSFLLSPRLCTTFYSMFRVAEWYGTNFTIMTNTIPLIFSPSVSGNLFSRSPLRRLYRSCSALACAQLLVFFGQGINVIFQQWWYP